MTRNGVRLGDRKAGVPCRAILRDVGRSDRIRTYDPLVPNEVRYQAALHSDMPGRDRRPVSRLIEASARFRKPGRQMIRAVADATGRNGSTR